MKFLFIYPVTRKSEYVSNTFRSSKSFLPPLGLLYLAKILELNSHDVEIIDLNAENINIDSLKKLILSSDAVGLTLYSSERELNYSMMISDLIKNTCPEIPIIIGGPHCSIKSELALKQHHADICAKGSACHSILPIAEALEGKRKMSTISDICYRSNNKIIHTKKSNRTTDKLDKIPFPARHLVEKYDYGYLYGVKLSKGKTTSITFAQGCPFHCRFCDLHVYIPKYRVRSIENFKEEIDELIDQDYKTIVFIDDNFIVNKKNVENIMDYFIKKDSGMNIWILNARVDCADSDLFKKMKNAGVEHIGFGLESGNQDVLDFYNKKITVNQIKDVINLSNEMGFFTSASFILGAPIETSKHIETTIQFARSLPLDYSVFYPFAYLYTSDIWQEEVRKGRISSDEQLVLCNLQRGLGNFTTEEIIDFTIKAQKTFFMNPKLWMRTLVKAVSKRNINLLKFGFKLLS